MYRKDCAGRFEGLGDDRIAKRAVSEAAITCCKPEKEILFSGCNTLTT